LGHCYPLSSVIWASHSDTRRATRLSGPLARGDRPFRALRRVGDHAFAPAGAPAVRVTFEVRDDKAVALSIEDGALCVTASRRD